MKKFPDSLSEITVKSWTGDVEGDVDVLCGNDMEAELIRRYNSHDALLAACKDMLAESRNGNAHLPSTCRCALCQRFRAAIASATGANP